MATATATATATHIVWGRVEEGESASSRNGSSTLWSDELAASPKVDPLRRYHGSEVTFVSSSEVSSQARSNERTSSSGKSGQGNLRACPEEGRSDRIPEHINWEGVEYAEAARLREALEDVEGVWSRGSTRHADGTCKACHYMHTSRGCANGTNCQFCHIPHTNSGRTKVGASKRQHCKLVAAALLSKYQDDPETYKKVGDVASSRSTFLAWLLDYQLQKLSKSGDDDKDEPPEFSTGSTTAGPPSGGSTVANATTAEPLPGPVSNCSSKQTKPKQKIVISL